MAQHGKILVSGATGTVGGQVVKKLAEAGAGMGARPCRGLPLKA